MKMIINGQQMDASDKATQSIINPATGKEIDTVPSATAGDVKKAVDGAVAAQEAWAALPVRERCIILRRFADMVMEKRLELGEMLAKEAGKPYMKEAVWELDKLVIGDPMDPKVNMGPMIAERAAKMVEEQVNSTVAQGARIARGGKRNGAFYDPTILVDVTPEMAIARDMEVFGPVWPVIGFDTVDEAVAIANSSQYGLGGGLFSRNIYTCLQTAKRLKTGHVAINGSGNFRAAELPFGGGKKMSGNSRESLSKVMDEVTQLKSIVFRYAFHERG